MIDEAFTTLLERGGVRCCLIGAVAMAIHGYARATSDVDLLTIDPRVLAPGFWPADAGVELHLGDDEDPLAGVVRKRGLIEHDLIVGRGYAARYAIETASAVPGAPVPVATPLALVLLKLVAGAARDRLDVLELVRTRRMIDGAPWLAGLPAHVARLPPPAQAIHAALARDLAVG